MRKPTLKTLRKKLDLVFGAWIRNRDTVNGKGSCITCGVFTELEAGHFIPRQHAATRWDERNVWGQCSRCNRWLHGDQAEYYLALVRKLGQEIVDGLMELKKTTKKHTPGELRALIDKYQL